MFYYCRGSILFFFFNDTATTEIYTLSLHDALPIGIRSDKVHVVLDEHDALDAGLAGRIDQRIHDPVFVGSRYPGGRFVEKDYLRLECKRRGGIEKFLLALREPFRNDVEPILQSENFS